MCGWGWFKCGHCLLLSSWVKRALLLLVLSLRRLRCQLLCCSCLHVGCGIVGVASRVDGVWGMGHRRGRQVVASVHAGEAMEAHGVMVAVRRPLVG